MDKILISLKDESKARMINELRKTEGPIYTNMTLNDISDEPTRQKLENLRPDEKWNFTLNVDFPEKLKAKLLGINFIGANVNSIKTKSNCVWLGNKFENEKQTHVLIYNKMFKNPEKVSSFCYLGKKSEGLPKLIRESKEIEVDPTIPALYNRYPIGKRAIFERDGKVLDKCEYEEILNIPNNKADLNNSERFAINNIEEHILYPLRMTSTGIRNCQREENRSKLYKRAIKYIAGLLLASTMGLIIRLIYIEYSEPLINIIKNIIK